jgi:geranylgeranyl diphosphate synthase type I
MTLDSFTEAALPAVEAELQRIVARANAPGAGAFHEMMTFHMGWSGQGAGPAASGKRLRPLLTLLTCQACGADWRLALPAAASIELVHNFSLVHDDIQDNSDTRRGRPTVWKKWGMPQAITGGDALFVLAHLALLDTPEAVPADRVLRAAAILEQACLALCTGQYLDISYEKRSDLAVDDYWPMVAGKTAALIAASTQVGALLGGADQGRQDAFRSFGHHLGMAFQVQDDLLGIWGDSALTGKSNQSDLLTGKKSLPVLHGIGRGGAFAKRWAEGPIRPDEVASLSEQLAEEGARLFAQERADQMTDLALQSLRAADPQGEAGEALHQLVRKLLEREA